eukprot:662488-Prorocentrum_minimum.AAC.5
MSIATTRGHVGHLEFRMTSRVTVSGCAGFSKSSLPSVSPLQKEHPFSSCALVASSADMLLGEYGAEIDAHEVCGKNCPSVVTTVSPICPRLVRTTKLASRELPSPHTPTDLHPRTGCVTSPPLQRLNKQTSKRAKIPTPIDITPIE